MTLRKAIGKAHLWLGLTSGLLVFFLGLTGCILAFQQEIEALTGASFRKVVPQQRSFLPPSALQAAAERSLGPDRPVVSLEYGARDEAALAYFYNAKDYWQVHLNPYTGAVLRRQDMSKDFFRLVVDGHFRLWLPPAIGRPIISSATLVFVVMLVTGLVLWWPKNKAARKQRFSVKWTAKWRRLNYDLHNVPGFYALLLGLIIALSGLVMGFQWVAKSVYWVSSGGHSLPVPSDPASDTTAAPLRGNATDLLWQRYRHRARPEEHLSVVFPATAAAPVELVVNHRPGTYYNQDVYHYDRYTLRELPAAGVFHGTYAAASGAARLNRMNYDIHVGAIGGWPTKILAFGASLVAASLPVTGFIIWWGRRNKKPKAKPAKAAGRIRKPALQGV